MLQELLAGLCHRSGVEVRLPRKHTAKRKTMLIVLEDKQPASSLGYSLIHLVAPHSWFHSDKMSRTGDRRHRLLLRQYSGPSGLFVQPTWLTLPYSNVNSKHWCRRVPLRKHLHAVLLLQHGGPHLIDPTDHAQFAVSRSSPRLSSLRSRIILSRAEN